MRRWWWIRATGALAFLALSIWAWNSSPLNIKDRLFPKHLAAVEPSWLYRSGQIAPNLIESTLRELNIDLILDLSHDRGTRDPAQAAEKRAAEQLGIERVNVPLAGSGLGSVPDYARAVATLARAERSGLRVLVHCRAGDRRTGGVLAAFLLLVDRRSGESARRELDRFARRSADESGLVAFLDTHLPKVGVQLTRQGVISGIPDPFPKLARKALEKEWHMDLSVWLIVGLAGQLAFGSRFVLQWLASERARRSVVPEAFWWLSLCGSALLLIYAVERRDPVFILGQSSGALIYLRNLMLLRKSGPDPVMAK